MKPSSKSESSHRPAGCLSDRDRRRLERLSGVMDTRFRVPGTDFRFGADALIGLIPGVGDGTSAALSFYPLWVAHHYRFSLLLRMRMLWRILIDLVVGLIPVLGDAFDAWYKCVQRNVADLLREDAKRVRRGTPEDSV